MPDFLVTFIIPYRISCIKNFYIQAQDDILSKFRIIILWNVPIPPVVDAFDIYSVNVGAIF